MAESFELATGYVSLAVSTAGMGKDIAREFGGVQKVADTEGKKAGKKFGAGFSTVVKGALGAASILGGIGAVTGFLKDANAEAREAQKVGAVTAQVIKATGGAAKVTAEQVGDLATAISSKTGMDDEAIQSGANLLLTFKNVRNEAGAGAKVFDRATAAAADLSAAGFGSVEGASKMLGKALNDPVKGLSALGRAGVTFTDQQKEQIKTLTASGDVLGAQKIILEEVESQVGGVAAASATASEKLAVSFGNFKEQVGTALLPVIDDLAVILTDKVIPAVSGMVTDIQAAVKWAKDWDGVLVPLAASLGIVVVGLKALAIQQAITAAGGMLAYIKGVTVATRGWAAGQAVLNVVMAMNPIGLVIIGIVALVAAIVIAYKKSETFRKVVQAVWAGVKKAVAAVVTWFRREVPAAVDRVKKNWATLKEGMVAPIRWVRDKVGGILTQLREKFANAVTAIGRAWDRIRDVAKAPVRFVIETVLENGILAAFRKISDLVGFKGGANFHIGLPAGFASGGWTGPGSRFQPAGIVHADEYVISKPARRRIERQAPGYLDYLNQYGRLPGYFLGGGVSPLAGASWRRHNRGYPWARWAGDGNRPNDMGAPIQAYKAGVVAAIRFLTTSYGRHIRINHGSERTLYAHLSSIGVRPGQRVDAGEVIGRLGNTGNSFGPHIHFELQGGSGKLDMGGVVSGAVKAGYDSFVSMFRGLISRPLDRLGGVGGGAFGDMLGGIPRMLIGSMVDRVATFDSGGILKPGLTLAYNGTGKNERVLTAEQSGGVVITGGNFGYSPDEIAEAIERRRRRQLAMRAPRFATA